MSRERRWNVTVIVIDRPEEDEDYKTEREIRDFINSKPEAGVEIEVQECDIQEEV